MLATSDGDDWDPMFSSFWNDLRKTEENFAPDTSKAIHPFLLCHLDKRHPSTEVNTELPVYIT